MTLVISKGITLAKANNGIVDPDAIIYINNVEKADGENLEYDTAKAIHDFVVGCKADGIWNAIKASCILAGARTLQGALVPLVGAAPTNVGPFVSGDYNRKTGLAGNGSTKYLNSNRLNSADPQDSFHLSLSVSTAASSGTQMYIGGQGAAVPNDIYRDGANLIVRSRTASATTYASQGSATGFIGHSRAVAASFTSRLGGATQSNSFSSSSSTGVNIFVFARNNNGSLSLPTDARFAFYSIGESLDLALLDARVTDLINAFAAAIP
jgi:hypothetical protein